MRRRIRPAPVVWHRIDSALCSLSPPSDSYKPLQINDLIVSREFLSLFGDETAFSALSGIFANRLK